MRYVEGPVCSGSSASCAGLSDLGFPFFSEFVVIIHDCVNVAVQTDGWLL